MHVLRQRLRLVDRSPTIKNVPEESGIPSKRVPPRQTTGLLSLSLSFIFPRRLSSTYLRLLSPPLSLSLSDRSSERGENLVWSARGWRGRGNHNEETLIRGNFPHAAAVKQTLIIPEHFAATTHSRRVFTGSRYNVKSRQNGEKKYLKKRYARSRGCKENIYRRLPSKNFSSLPIPRDFTLDISCFQPVNSGQIFRRICPKAFHLVCVCVYTHIRTHIYVYGDGKIGSCKCIVEPHRN